MRKRRAPRKKDVAVVESDDDDGVDAVDDDSEGKTNDVDEETTDDEDQIAEIPEMVKKRKIDSDPSIFKSNIQKQTELLTKGVEIPKVFHQGRAHLLEFINDFANQFDKEMQSKPDVFQVDSSRISKPERGNGYSVKEFGQ